MLAGITSFVFGAAGAAACWVLLEFVGKPFRKFFDMKRDGLEVLSLYGNVEVPPLSLFSSEGSSPIWKRIRDAQDVFRSHGSRFLAFAATEHLPVRALKLFGFDPEQAGRGFIGLSNTLDEYGASRHQNRVLIERSLRASI